MRLRFAFASLVRPVDDEKLGSCPWADGRNVRIDQRWTKSEVDCDRFRTLGLITVPDSPNRRAPPVPASGR
jgi:hypothetical protein